MDQPWTNNGLECERDPLHAESVVRQSGIGFDGKGSVTTPGTNIEEDEADEELDSEGAHKYRSLTARANVLAQDRADIKFCTKELSWFMAKPTHRVWPALRGLGKHLRMRPRYVQVQLAIQHGAHQRVN